MHPGIFLLAAFWTAAACSTQDEPEPAPDRRDPPLPAAPAGAHGDGEALARILLGLDGRPAGDVWNAVHALLSEHPDGSEPLSAFVRRSDFFELPEATRLAAVALVRLSQRDEALRNRALTALLEIAANGRVETIRLEAIRLLGEAREIDRILRTLASILAGAVAENRPEVVIAACLSLDRLDSTTSRRPVLLLAEDATQPFEVRSAAALALAQMAPRGPLAPAVLSILRQLSREPTARGALARVLWERHARRRDGNAESDARVAQLEQEIQHLLRRLERVSPLPGEGDALEELLDLVEREYLDSGRIDREELAVAAFKELAGGLDHSAFLSPADLERMRARSLGRHLGVGAEFFKLDRDAPLVVVRWLDRLGPLPLERRLRAGDRVVAIDGVPTRGLAADAIRDLLAEKKPRDPIRVEVARWGRAEPLAVELEHGTFELPVLVHELFPGAIGYVRLERFVPGAARELEEAITDLEGEAGTLEGLILDLRDNRGGLLEEAVRVVDLFVGDDGAPIVSQVGGDGRPVREFLPAAGAVVSCPMVAIVDQRTASSAEVVAGALQDLRRATVVGRRTYGKGVSQRTHPAPPSANRLAGGESSVLLPNYYLQLPSGRRFHAPRDASGRRLPGALGGIEPDVEVEQIEDGFDGAEREEFLRVQYSETLFNYLQKHYVTLKEHWKEDPRNLLDPMSCPDFDSLEKALASPLGDEELRVALRSLLRRHLEEEREQSFPSLLQDDRQLQAALRVLGIRPRTHPEYAGSLPWREGD